MLQEQGESSAEGTARLQQQFLLHDRPVVEAAAEVIIAAASGGALARDLCIVPGGRARRLLLAALVETARRRGITIDLPRLELPAGVVTAALEVRDASKPAVIATELEWSLALRDAIGSLSGAERVALLGSALANRAAPAWRSAIDVIARSLAELAAARRTPAAAAAHVRALGGDESRYRALGRALDLARERLRAEGLIERDELGEALLARGEPAVDRIWVVDAFELNQQVRDAIRRCAASGAEVVALIGADERDAGRFDEFGCPTSAWATAAVAIDDGAIMVADTARDQAEAALQAIHRIAPTSASDVVIGVTDPALTPTLRRAAQAAGLRLHDPTGRAFSKSSPALALRLLADHLRGERSDTFAALVRHPQVRGALKRSFGGADPVIRFDEALAIVLNHRIASDGTGVHPPMTQIAAALADLLGPLARRDELPLGKHAHHLAAFLKELEHWPEDDETTDALEAAMSALRELRDVPAALAPRCPPLEAIEYALAVTERVKLAEKFDRGAIDVLGWLELPFDRAGAMVVLGMNEGFVPRTRAADPWLPDGLRRALEMPDALASLARDKAMLAQLVARRRDLTLIVGRRDARGDPLAPSRAVLATSGEALARRVARLTDPDQAQGRHRRWPLRVAPSTTCEIPAPAPPIELKRLRVTAFSEFFRCPRRFWLSRIERLREVAPAPSELDPMDFGNVAHAALESLKDVDIGRSSDAQRIARHLAGTVERLMLERFGTAPRTALLVQAVSLTARLERFARFQAEWARAGWQILAIEQEFPDDVRLPMPADEGPLIVTGRVDRIDVHPELGVRIIDFKTGDSAADPVEDHIGTDDQGKAHWINLQLPLYRALLGPRLPEIFPGRVSKEMPIEVGYVPLSADLDAIGWRPARFSLDDASAVAAACDVVRRVRRGDVPMTQLGAMQLEWDPYRYLLQAISLGVDDEDDIA